MHSVSFVGDEDAPFRRGRLRQPGRPAYSAFHRRRVVAERLTFEWFVDRWRFFELMAAKTKSLCP